MSIFVLGSLDMLTAFPWTADHVGKQTHSYPSKAAVRACRNAAMLEDIPQLLLTAVYFGVTDQVQLVPIISCCVTVVQILWTVFTKTYIMEGFDALDEDALDEQIEMRRTGPSRVAPATPGAIEMRPTATPAAIEMRPTAIPAAIEMHPRILPFPHPQRNSF